MSSIPSNDIGVLLNQREAHSLAAAIRRNTEYATELKEVGDWLVTSPGESWYVSCHIPPKTRRPSYLSTLSEYLGGDLNIPREEIPLLLAKGALGALRTAILNWRLTEQKEEN